MNLFRSPAIFLLGLWLAACSDKSAGDGSAASASDSGGSTVGQGSTSSATEAASVSDSTNDPTSATLPGPTSTGDPSGGTATGSETGGGFLQQPDGGVAGQCDPTVQDCPADEKCTAISDTPGDPWGINVCVPKMGDAQVGDPCDIENGKYTGLDNCDVGLICLLTDDEGKGGACVEFCDVNVTCPDTPGAKCVSYNDGSLPICLNSCDPLVQDCPEGQACYNSAGDNFVCFKESAMPGEGMPGAECTYINQCQAGSFCAAAASVAGCAGTGCCTPYCPVSEGSALCNEVGGEMCVAFFAEGSAPPGLEDVGVCAIPE